MWGGGWGALLKTADDQSPVQGLRFDAEDRVKSILDAFQSPLLVRLGASDVAGWVAGGFICLFSASESQLCKEHY